MDDKLILKNRLKEARMEKGLSQQQLADTVGVSRNTVSSIETGQFNPTAKLALVLCIALDKKFEDLFFSDQNKRRPTGDPSKKPACEKSQAGFVLGGY